MNILNPKNNQWFALTAGLTIAAVGVMAPSAKAATYTLDFETGADGGSILYNTDGTLKGDQWADWGLTNISGINDRHDGAAKLNLYNTNEGGRDNDLRTASYTKSNGKVVDYGTPAQGNVLIIQEEDGNSLRSNGTYKADDEARGGYLDFDFAEAVAFNSFSLLDIDDNGGGITVEGQKADGGVLNIDIDALMAEHHRVNGTNESAAQGTSVTMNGITMTQVGNRQGDNSMFKFDVNDAHLTSVRFSYPGSGAISGLAWDTIDDGPQEIPEPSAMAGLLMLGLAGKRLKRKRDEAVALNNA
ncbi:MAG: PEP-CTERM sorting domain-containing protein [Cyanobacteria bacterium J06606_4]